MKPVAILVLVLAARSAAGSVNNAPPVRAALVCFTGIELTGIALTHPDGASWDPDGGAPDVALVIESYASLEDYSSADTVRTAPVPDVTGTAAWETTDPLAVHEEGALVIRVLDSDDGGIEQMDSFTIETAVLADGENCFEAEGGSRIVFSILRIDG